MTTGKNKQDLIDIIAAQADISKSAAEIAINTFCETVTATLAEGGKVAIVNFGTFETSHRKERTGRNPRTGVEMQIPAATIAKFKAGKKLKEAVN
ncbi:MAG: DNA-binding protein HU [Gammaproteobacteria bacterium CG_4_10_14_0_8_um_filter_38_16]|nr:MAG: DNA-binding protein HU [Gammaproteobacteria bacterium CG_4_10_14_0_8_um_filter_38_16]PJA02886.1 MAG: DNA-binding protein HU [Gammaproteobacteria bacterium CG_4_10_14_0_2_um_filter_38_22]PJB10950.1 MAG: DNA-binding protein HU [Gammaproteobacteria bacterium CG_4_9_14_3_um_filter_38_9]